MNDLALLVAFVSGVFWLAVVANVLFFMSRQREANKQIIALLKAIHAELQNGARRQ